MTLTRREFLVRSAQGGVGLVIATCVPAWARAEGAAAPFAPNVFVRVAPDETITVTMIRHEMGQGVRTVLPMMVAEELEADWRRIRLEQAVTGPAFKGVELHTSGSGSSRGTVMVMRRAGAAAREMLIAAAATRWQVAPGECQAKLGEVIHGASGRRLSYGKLAADAASQPVPQDPPLKSAEAFTILGTPRKRFDGPDIVTGRAVYGIDVRVPGMRFASIERAPVLGARYRHHDDAAARRLPGVIATVPVTSGIQHGVAVVATSTFAALRARRALQIDWDMGPHAAFDSNAFDAALDAQFANATFKVRHTGDAAAALKGAARRFEATYRFPFQAHAPLETMNCTADVRGDRAEFWAPTQTQRRCMQIATRVTGLPEDAIRIHAVMMGGAFGRRLYADYLGEAAEVSKAIRAPVQVVWTREDDMRHGYFQPCTADRFEAGLDAGGRLIALAHRTLSSDHSIYDIHEGRPLYGGPPPAPKAPDAYESDESPWGAFDNPYAIPNLQVDAANVPSPVPYGPWRAVMYPGTVWGRESFLDELAHLAGVDPLAFRLALLDGPPEKIGSYLIDRARLAAVHRLAAEKAGWGTPIAATNGRKRGRGIAANVYHGNSYLAQVAEVSVAPDLSDVRVHRIVCAVDVGFVLNPLGLEGQAESGITWGLSYALAGRIEFKDGRATARGYADFPVMRMDRMPATEIHVVPSTVRSAGFGEHPVPTVAPAVANAVFAATGVRLRTLPITPESLREARARG